MTDSPTERVAAWARLTEQDVLAAAHYWLPRSRRSYMARWLARRGGISQAIRQQLKKHRLDWRSAPPPPPDKGAAP